MLEVFVTVLYFSGVADKELGPSVEDLVSANQAAVESVRYLDMRIEVYRTGWRGGRLDKPIHLSTQRWSKDLDRERQRYRQHFGRQPDAEGNPQNLGDLIESPDQRRVLLNWDPLQPRRITPHKQRTVRAYFEPPSPNLPGPFSNPAASFALFQIQGNLDDTRWTLAQLVAASPSVEVSELTGERGKRLWQLAISHPDNKTNGRFTKSRYEIVLDPSVNYLASRVVAYIADTDPSPDSIVPIRMEREVTEFGQTRDGTYFPKRAVARMYDGTAAPEAPPASEQLRVAEDVLINAELPSDAFDFTFPENAVVTQLPAVDGSYPLHVWGPDDKPARTYTGDYHDFRFPDPEELAQEFAEPFQALYRFAAMAITAAIMVALVILIYMRRRRGRLSSP
ncbi:MAG: hypothetical protein WD851_00255 [Pirellulales bacterium]